MPHPRLKRYDDAIDVLSELKSAGHQDPETMGILGAAWDGDLLSFGLIYCDPSRELKFWRPTPSALLALGLRSHTDIPALKSSRSGSTRRRKFGE